MLRSRRHVSTSVSTENYFSRLPNEVLERIVAMTRTQEYEWMYIPTLFYQNSELAQLSLVDRRLRIIAQRQLYRHVYFDHGSSHGIDGHRFDGTKPRSIRRVLSMFCRTLRSQQYLASAARTISYGTSHRSRRSETILLAQIVPLCTNLTGLEIRGWIDSELFLPILRQSCPRLTRFKITCKTLVDEGAEDPESLGGVSVFLELLQCWKDIQEVVVDDNVFEPEERNETYPTVPNSCPVLRSLTFKARWIHDKEVEALSIIAPSIRYLHLDNTDCSPLSGDGLAVALEHWSQSLVSLTISSMDGLAGSTCPSPTFNDILASMPRLRDLKLDAGYLSNKSLAHGFSNLIGYDVPWPEVSSLVTVLQNKDSLPSLCKITAHPFPNPYLYPVQGEDKEEYDSSLALLQECCHQRKINYVQTVF
ncbi:hypothetical protein BV25DRAFT_1543478 [Artomyces pyxidatus]|uniref:Uncharacterized protein n=1 Tax=Artomyces pyxidatus TaxID=48021 RepID=A0ACB8SKJ9_9AGAM|nr:hypothetical protein BV25DRAFT_1543478 [Artomyces pyxidatus]